jgi:hypothetical protein
MEKKRMDLPQINTEMKMNKLLPFICATVLFASCTQDEAGEVLKAGEPVEINLSLGLADADGPDVTLSTSNAVVAKASNGSGATVLYSDASDAALKVSYSGPDNTSLRATTTLSNVWVLQFDSTGVIGTAGNCVAANYLGTVTTGEYLNPTLVSGTGQVIYVLANGPTSGAITTSTYTLTTFKESAAFTGTITDDSAIPYIGRIAGGATLTGLGTIKNFATVTLQRIAAKVSLTLNFNVTGFTFQSAKLCNAPLNMYYLYGADSTTFPFTPSASNINASAVTANVVPSTATDGTYVWYTGENKRGENTAITSAFNKYSANTPGSSAYCSYVRITATKDDDSTQYYYDLYLGANGTTDFNVKRNWEYTINAIISGTADLQAVYDVSDGRISTKQVTANCYIVAPSNAITIPVNVKGNGDDVAGTGLSTTHTAASVGVLWQTSAGLVTVSGFSSSAQTVTVTAGTASGNAVIAAYDTDGTTILWSWHIWVTSYNPNTSSNGTTYSYTNTSSITNVWMDRNLGATSVATADVNTLGLLYQWGRKDPFVNASTYNGTTALSVTGTAITPTSGSTTLATAIANPTYFYYNGSSPYDWNSSPNDLLWGGASYGAAKTIFDPCPAGWRVPSWNKTSTSASPWIGLASYQASTYWSTNGFQWTTTPGIGFWPAAGYRSGGSGGSGVLYDVGSYGSYWSASSYSRYGFRLAFYGSSVYPATFNERAFAFSVRCVQEF